jgi:hypothetical protein
VRQKHRSLSGRACKEKTAHREEEMDNKFESTIEVNTDGAVAYAKQILRAIKAHPTRFGQKRTSAVLSRESGLSERYVRELLFGNSRSIALSDLSKIFRYAASVASQEQDDAFRYYIASKTNSLKEQIRDVIGGSSAERSDETLILNSEYMTSALSRFLNIDPSTQKDFGKRVKGNYLLFRYDRTGNIVVSAMAVLYSPGEHFPLPVYKTWRATAFPGAERVVRGYIYRADDHVLALGRIAGKSTIRYSILREIENGERTDMYGLRLGISSLDNGPYAYRIYARHLSENVPEAEINNLISRKTDPESTRSMLRAVVIDIDDILESLKVEASSEGGMGLPLSL